MNPLLAPRRVRGKKGRGAEGKTIVFGILERQGKVYTEIAPDASKKPLQAVIRGQAFDSIIHSDGWRGYNGLVDMGYQEVSPRPSVTNLREAIAISTALNHSGSYAKRRLARSKGVPRHTFHLHLKECEFRFHHREKNL